jgi:hypothetical protein
MHRRDEQQLRRTVLSRRDDAPGLAPVASAQGQAAKGRLWLAGALLCATAVLCVLVVQVSEVFCDERCQARSWVLNWHLLGGVLGLVAAGAMTVSAAVGSRRVALVFLLVAVGLLSAVVVDVAQDGLENTAFAL